MKRVAEERRATRGGDAVGEMRRGGEQGELRVERQRERKP